MVFVIGGSYNNKLEFVLKKYNLTISDVYTYEQNQSYNKERVFNNFHKMIKELFKKGKSLDEINNIVKELLKKEDIIIISDEVGYGIVPMDREDRLFREVNGRISCEIAAKADEVYRVMYGIGMKIKGE